MAQAQFDPSVFSSLKTLQDNDQIPGGGGIPRNPLQPTGFPNPDAKRPDETVDAQGFRFINADEPVERKGRNVHLKGNVEFLARGYHVRADEAEGNLTTEVFTVRGHVLITGNGTTIYGDEVTVDFASGTYVARRAESQIGRAC